ncbi:MAG TPA: CHAT domain-containing protein [Pyrinomonadaceae bacterium]|nr:CHAT domain-containing protein [Pyrinomonadaceae bacterium]
MSKRVVLAEYFTSIEATYLFLAREDFDQPEIIKIPLTLEEITTFVFESFRAESQGQTSVSTHDKLRALDEDSFCNFFAPLVDPLVSATRDNKPIINEDDVIWFVPHDVLHYLPLHALKVEGRHLIDRNPVCYTPSAAVMKYCQGKRKGRRQTALVFADSRNDLVHARDEAVHVSRLFQTTPFLGERATKENLLDQLRRSSDFDVLHFSCHGYFNHADALQSGIVLATNPEDENQDNLTAEEIFDLQLNADLITLSACESGVSEREPGDELIGLTRALIFAGTPSVLVTLWSVDDLSTNLLIERFYEELLSDAPEGPVNKVEALRLAQLYVKNLPAKEVVESADKRLIALGNPDQFDLKSNLLMNKAYAQTAAGDLQAALETYSQLATETRNSSNLVRIEQTIDLLKFKLAESSAIEVHYEIKPFSHLYHWAPFILVGDWQ